MLDVLKKCFGKDVYIEKWTPNTSLLIFMAVRTMYKISVYGKEFVLVELSEKDRFGVIALQKQIKMYEESLKTHVGFVVRNLTTRQKESLIEHGIPFVSEPDQVYLPFLGLMLTDSAYHSYSVNKDRMTPTSQLVFLYFAYNRNPLKRKSEIASELGITKMSMTRASRQLMEMKLLSEEDGCIQSVATGEDLYQLAKGYVINPVQKKIYIRKDDWLGEGVLAGENALAEYSMLNPPQFKTYAIDRNVDISNLKSVNPKWESEELICLEIWKYNPYIFSKNRIADVISLACSLKDEVDERVEMSIDEMLEEHEW